MIYKADCERFAMELADVLENAPTGGTDRERQAWRNGFEEAVDAVGWTLHQRMGLNVNGNRRFNWGRFLKAVGVEDRFDRDAG